MSHMHVNPLPPVTFAGLLTLDLTFFLKDVKAKFGLKLQHVKAYQHKQQQEKQQDIETKWIRRAANSYL